MKYTLAALTLALAATAAPSPAPAEIEARQTSIIFFVCQDKNFVDSSATGGGRCERLNASLGTCNNLGNGYNNAITSCGPPTGFTCTLYDGNDCTGASIAIVNPGVNNLADHGFNDRASSYRCVSG